MMHMSPDTAKAKQQEISQLGEKEAYYEGLSPHEERRRDALKAQLKNAGEPWWEGSALVIDFGDEEEAPKPAPPPAPEAIQKLPKFRDVPTIAKTYQRQGRAARGTKRGNLTQVTVVLPPGLLTRVRAHAHKNGFSLGEAMRRLVTNGLRS